MKKVKEAAKSAGRSEPNVLAFKLDVTDRTNIEVVAKEVSKALDGRIDVLINNAGYLSAFRSIQKSDPDDWWNHFEVNVKSIYLVTRAFLPLLSKSSLKVVVNLSSIAGVKIAPQGSAYGMTKLAVMRFTEYIAEDHKNDGVLAFAVHPGGVATELAHNLPEGMHDYLIDTPELSGDTLVWLGAERREWLSGRYLTATWDMEELSARKDEIVKGDLLKDRLAINALAT